MANWDFVFRYDERAAEWLASEDYPHPPLRVGNRLPCAGEVMQVIEELGHSASPLPITIEGLDWDDDQAVPTECFQIRGDLVVELRILVKLSERCGQFWVYHDTGEPAIIVDCTLEPEGAAALYEELVGAEDA